MCQHCKAMEKIADAVIDIIVRLLGEHGENPNPQNVTVALNFILDRVAEDVFMAFAKVHVSKLALELGLEAEASNIEIAQELVRQHKAGTLPEKLSALVAQAMEAIQQSEKDDNSSHLN